MKLKTFKRGVHPFEAKEYAMDSAIKSVTAGAELVFPLSQSIGKPAKAVVSVGDRVLKGSLIAEAGGFISAPIFSSVSGTVKAIKNMPALSGSIEAVVIENDNKYETAEGFGTERSLDDLTAEDIREILMHSGIVGLGGAGFPTAVKLSPKNPQDIDTVIINGAECEPYLTSDYRLMLEKSDELIQGAEAIRRLFPKARVVFGIENNKPDAIKLLSEKLKYVNKITVCPLKTKFPQGGERQLIYAVTGRKINSKMLPADVGCIVLNAGTCYAVYEAVYKSMPLIHNIMTVTGEGANSPCNLDVPLGVSHKEVLEQAGGAKDGVVKFISGGPMMGIAMSSIDVPVVKTSSAILAYLKDDVAALSQSNCIHCGKCLQVCPQVLVPQMMAKAVKSDDIDRFVQLGGMECIECGCCSYICPAKIPLTQMFKLGKVKAREAAAGK